MKKRIAIVSHGYDLGFPKKTLFFIRLLAEEWREMGIEVEFLRGISRFVPADVAISHVDLTHTPDDYLEFLARYPVVINGNLVDILKSRIGDHLLGAESDWDGPVIVKTDLNSRGMPEWRTSEGIRRARFRVRLARKLGLWKRDPPPAFPEYPIYDSFRDVPTQIREDSRMVIQRFLPEMDDGAYVLRLLFLFGSRHMSTKARSHEPIVKNWNFISTETVDTPPGLLERVRALGVDFAKIDYVMRDGAPVILDVARTPTCSGPEPIERNLIEAKSIAPGIREFL